MTYDEAITIARKKSVEYLIKHREIRNMPKNEQKKAYLDLEIMRAEVNQAYKVAAKIEDDYENEQ